MRLTLISAMDENRLIGTGEGGLPWEGLPRDQDHLRNDTGGKALLLGRRTFEEMLGWFEPGQRPIVVTRDAAYQPRGGHPAVGGVEEGIALAEGRGEDELVVCGGAEIYRLALPLANDLNLTILTHRFAKPQAGGVYFPEWEGQGFDEERREWFGADAANRFGMTFLWLRRS